MPLLKRLNFDQSKINEVISGINSLIQLPDPVGTTLAATELDDGLVLYKVSCPIGVIGIIFESRRMPWFRFLPWLSRVGTLCC
jgi:glutamate-5-semialdehyde dehydrogenase